MSEQEVKQEEVPQTEAPVVEEQKETTKKGGLLSVSEGVVRMNYGVEFDKDHDGRPSAGVGGYGFFDLAEVLDEVKKDSAAVQILVKWIDANKSLLPEVKKEI